MKHRRGLTLLEALIAVAILSLLAATSIPILRKSLAVLHEPPPEIRLDELADLADAVIADPQAFGLEPDAFSALQPLILLWPDDPTRSAVHVLHLQPNDGDSAWHIFTCDGWSVSRWTALENTGQETKP